MRQSCRESKQHSFFVAGEGEEVRDRRSEREIGFFSSRPLSISKRERERQRQALAHSMTLQGGKRNRDEHAHA